VGQGAAVLLGAFPYQLVGGERNWAAFEKEQQIMKERGARVQVLVPLNLDGYLFSGSWKSGYQAQIRRRLAADFTQIDADSARFDAEVERLIRALRADEGAREKPPKGKL
jgi:hypothetical protein